MATTGKPFAVEPLGIAQGVVTADGDQGVDSQVFQVGDDMLREIVLGGGFGVVIGPPEETGNIGIGDLAGIGAAGVEEGSAAPVDFPDRLRVEGDGCCTHEMRGPRG